jgi:hypothetical protein
MAVFLSRLRCHANDTGVRKAAPAAYRQIRQYIAVQTDATEITAYDGAETSARVE